MVLQQSPGFKQKEMMNDTAVLFCLCPRYILEMKISNLKKMQQLEPAAVSR